MIKYIILNINSFIKKNHFWSELDILYIILTFVDN